MLKSMTGYGRNTVAYGESTIQIEVKSVNHRFLDLSAKLPGRLYFLEDALKREIKKHVARGRIDLFITIEGNELFRKKAQVDWGMLQQYVSHLHEIKDRHHLTGEISIDMVTRLEDVFTVEEVTEEEDHLQTCLLDGVSVAIEELVSMRKVEGEQLERDLRSHAKEAIKVLDRVENHRPVLMDEYKERVHNRILEYAELAGGIDEARLMQEIGILAEKSDVTEELTRLRSHIHQLLSLLNSMEPVGRRLDFLIQEMHREINTIGSKSNHIQVTEAVIELKSKVEKLKEQVQNIE